MATQEAAIETPAASVEEFETIVIGGGQAGLAVGYYLKKGGGSFVILDANEQIGGSWRTRTWSSLRLFTPARYDGLHASSTTARPIARPRSPAVTVPR
jgi:putative flavoprotein involved in K+ transport